MYVCEMYLYGRSSRHVEKEVQSNKEGQRYELCLCCEEVYPITLNHDSYWLIDNGLVLGYVAFQAIF